jgi:CheY-like chemotaxis protein
MSNAAPRRAAEAMVSNTTTTKHAMTSSLLLADASLDSDVRLQVRRPLQAAVGLVELLGATTLDVEQQRYVSLLREAVDAMLTAVGTAPVARPLDGTCIVVIDDVASNRMYATEVLQRAGAQVFSCADAEQALLLLAQQSVSLVVLDLEMPGLGGLEFLRRLRAQPAPLNRLPVLVLSAADERTVAVAVSSASATFLSKPASIHDIVAFASQAIDAAPVVVAADGTAVDASAIVDEAAFSVAVTNNDRPRLAMLIGAVRVTDARLAAELDDALGRGDLQALLLRLHRRRQPVTAKFLVSATLQRTFFDSLLTEEQRLRDARVGDHDVVRAIAHRIAGSAATFGAPELGVMARNISQVLAASADVDVEGLAVRLANGMAQFRQRARQDQINEDRKETRDDA